MPCDIYPDASTEQLGGVITQGGGNKAHPVAFYSQNPNPSQRNYTIMEKELLSIVEIVVHFCHILLGYHLRIKSDHRNLSFENFKSERVCCWRLILEEYD